MSTRAMIGMLRDDGTVRAIYSHWGSYPAHVGILLKKFYDTADAVTRLLNRGDVSSLGATLEETTFFHNLNIEADIEGETIETDAIVFEDVVEAVQYYTECWCDYFYIFEDGIWMVRDRNGVNRSLAGVLEDLRETAEEQ
jgi:hypothetical protein